MRIGQESEMAPQHRPGLESRSIASRLVHANTTAGIDFDPGVDLQLAAPAKNFCFRKRAGIGRRVSRIRCTRHSHTVFELRNRTRRPLVDNARFT